jgi:hypothetical protein
MASPLVSLIVLNWNGERFLAECIDSLSRLRYSPLEIIVVDNASTDGSRAMLAAMKGITVVTNSANLGYAGGMNVGMKAAKGVYAATLNNDITVDPEWLGRVIPLMESDSSIGIAGGRQMNYFDREAIDALYSFLHPSLIFFQEAFRKRYDPRVHGSAPAQVLGLSGASTIYRKRMFDELQGLDETLFAYHEESDLCMRAFLAGWKCVYVPRAVAYHRRNVSFNRVRGKMFFYLTRNRLLFIYKYSPFSLVLRNLGWILFTELRILRYVLFRERVLLSYARGIVQGFAGMAALQAVRRRNMELLRKRFAEYEMLRKKKFVPL